MAKWWERNEERIIRRADGKRLPARPAKPSSVLAVAAFNALFKASA